MNAVYQKNFEELKMYLNIEINDNMIEGQHKKKLIKKVLNPTQELFSLKINDLFKVGFSSFQKSIRGNVDSYIKKTNLSREFLLNTINNDILNYPIEDLIKILKTAKEIPIEQRRNCFSLSNNPMQTEKIIYNLKKLFGQLKISSNKIITASNANKENKPIQCTPTFKKNVNIIKQNSSKNVIGKNKNLAALYHSPSPVILHKNKKKIATNEKNRSHSKETYKTPDKKNWIY